MGKSPWNKVKRGRDVTKILRRNGCRVRDGKGSHRIAYLPNDEVMTYYENGEFPTGMRRKIIKTLSAVGFLVFAFAGGMTLAAGGFTELITLLAGLV
ncbi:MAG: type II toxin-antitoxin system HicA family toxin [Chloroflexota bacterium]